MCTFKTCKQWEAQSWKGAEVQRSVTNVNLFFDDGWFDFYAFLYIFILYLMKVYHKDLNSQIFQTTITNNIGPREVYEAPQ